jgi:hypothetical protein
MAERCNWILFYAHPQRFDKDEDVQPDFYGVFVYPLDRREPEALLEEMLSNRSLYLARIVEQRRMKLDDGWGLNEKLKVPYAKEGLVLSLMQIKHGALPRDL